MAHVVNEQTSEISQKIKHQICQAKVKAWDKRIGANSMKIYTMYFEMRCDFDDEKDPEGVVKTCCQKILNSLGYCFYCLIKYDIADYEYDAEETFLQVEE